MADAYDGLAEELVGGAQEEYVRRLTERLAAMLEAGVADPGRYAVVVGTAREEAMGVWASMQARVTLDARSAFEEALALEDEEIAAALLDAYGVRAAAGLTAMAQNAVAQAARGMAEVVRRQNVALAQTAADEWYRVVADAVARVQLGDSRRAVMEDAWAALSRAGIRTVDYKSGARTTIDAAIRRHVVTQQNQCRNDLLFRRMDEWGHDLVYVSAHWGARPSHSVWQGKVYSRNGSDPRYPALAPATGYGTVGGLCGANCRHTMTPYVEGLSKLPSTDFSAQERLTGVASDEWYEATQRQRALERKVREQKRAVALGQQHGCDMAEERYALGRTQARLRALCSECHLRRDYGRERAYGVAEQPRALGLGTRGPSLPAFLTSDGFKAASRSLGVPQARAAEALRARVADEGRDFRAMGPERQLRYLDETVRRLRKGATEAEARAHVLSACQPKVVLAQKQNAHVSGTAEWRRRCEANGGAVLQSEVTVTLDEVQRLVDELHGTGEMYVNGAQVREAVGTGGRIIGVWRSQDGRSAETDRLTIHYSKHGVHVVPSQPRRGDDTWN